MDILTPKERLIRAARSESVDRAPVICPGGMMNSAVVEVMEKTGNVLPKGHTDKDVMVALASDIQANTGFENFGVPFCMTVEAQVLGSEVDLGSLTCEPKIVEEKYKDIEQVEFLPAGEMEKDSRVQVVLETISQLSKKHPDVPVIGSITGPLSTAGSLVEPMTFLKQLMRKKDQSHRVLDYVTGHLVEYVNLMIEAGASLITIADPTATGEILGPRQFAEYAIPYLNRISEAAHRQEVPVIIHICGDVSMIKKQIAELSGDVISVDALVSLRKMKEDVKGLTAMGNISTYMLEFGSSEQIHRSTSALVAGKVDIIAPACGLSTSTPLKNINALTDTVKGN